MARDEVLIDAKGLYCPIPILRLAKAFLNHPSATVFRLLSTDPAAVEDVEVFCRERGHELIESRCDADVLSFRIRKGGRS